MNVSNMQEAIQIAQRSQLIYQVHPYEISTCRFCYVKRKFPGNLCDHLKLGPEGASEMLPVEIPIWL